MKHAILGAVIAIVLAGLLACGGGSTSAPSGLTNRVLVSNSLSTGSFADGTIQIINASNNTLSGNTITAGTAPGLMAVSPALDRTLVFDTSTNEVNILVNSAESDAAFISLPAFTESLIDKDTNTGFAAMPTVAVSGPTLGGVVVLDLVNAAIATVNVAGVNVSAIAMPGARRMVMNSQGAKLLVFSDNYTAPCSDGTSALTVLDISQVALGGSNSLVNSPAIVCGFDQAAWGVFSSDGNTAYIMNCGPECGGKKASVQPFDLTKLPSASSGTSIEVGFDVPAVPVPAATIGMLNGNTLYVAGTPGGTNGLSAGSLSVLSVNGGPSLPVAAPSVSIGDGYHTRMTMGANNKLFVGAINCTDNPNTQTGCLSIFDTGANTAVVDPGRGYVTGMAAIDNTNLVYVIEGGKLLIYDTTTSAESTTVSISIVGNLVDVKAIDQPQ